jgi:hypothetical protein
VISFFFNFNFNFFPFFKGFAACFTVWPSTTCTFFSLFSSLLYYFYLSTSLSFLSFFLGFVSINTVTQLTLNYT